MATVTKSIGTSSRDYSTITLWEADLDDTLIYSSGDDAVGECYNDSAFDEAVIIDGGGTVGLASTELTVASSERHDGTEGAGARIVRSTDTTGYVLRNNQGSAPTGSIVRIIAWLEVDANGNNVISGGFFNGATDSATQDIIKNTISHGQSGASSLSAYLLNRGSSYCVNNILYDCNNTLTGGGNTGLKSGTSSENWHNNTVYKVKSTASHTSGTSYGADFANVTASNNIVVDCVSDGSAATADFDGTSNYSLSSDSSAAGANSLTNKTAANQFVSIVAGSEDLHLKAGADAIGAGADLAATPDGVQYDINGSNRNALTATVWDMGAHQYASTASIGTSARDYSTITLWEADLDDGTIYGAGANAVGECYNDSAFDESVAIDGGLTVGLNTFTLTAATGEQHDGTEGTGVRIVNGATPSGGTLSVSGAINFITISDIEIDRNGYGLANGKTMVYANDRSYLFRMILHGSLDPSNGNGVCVSGFQKFSSVANCIIYDLKSTAIYDEKITGINMGRSGFASYCYNNTVFDLNTTSTDAGCIIRGITNAGGSVSNNISMDCTAGGGTAEDFNGTQTGNNLSSDSTASGTGSLTSKTAANQFVSTVAGSEDLHLKTGADAIDAGTDLVATPDGIQYDINGSNRNALAATVWDIGAHQYASTASIGTSSRDYSTIALWEADLDDGTIYGAGANAVGECYNDSAFDEQITIDGGGTVGLTSTNLTVASSERHDGTAGTGALLFKTSGGSPYFNITMSLNGVDRATEWLEHQRTGTTFGAIRTTSVTANTKAYIRNNICHNIDSGTTSEPGIITLANATSLVLSVTNNIIYDCDHTANNSTQMNGIALAGVGPNSFVANNTIHAIGKTQGTGDCHGIGNSIDDSDLSLKNNLSTDTTNSGSGSAKDYENTSLTNTNSASNMSSDATSPETGLRNVVTSDQFVSTVSGSEDLHLKAGSDAIDAGTDLAATPDGVQYDIDGRDRDAEGDTWDIGADEFVRTTPATITKSIGTSSRDYSTITLWEASLDDTGTYISGDDAVGECYNDSTFTTGLDFVVVSVSKPNSATLTVADGEGHDGTYGTGVTINSVASNVIRYRDTIVPLTINHIELTSSGGSIAIRTNRLGVYKRMLVHNCTSLFTTEGGQEPATLMNSFLYSSTTGPNCLGHRNYNNTIYNMTNDGVTNAVAVNGGVIKNTISVGNGGEDFDTATAQDESFCISSDTTASGTGSLTNKTAANLFVSIVGGSEDLHLKSGADAIGAATDLAATPDGVQYDINGSNRNALTATVWDIGGHQYASTASIGTSSRDYSTITLWEADLDDTTVYGAGANAVGECYNDSTFDEYNIVLNGGQTVGLNSVELTVAETERHDGTAGTGAKIDVSEGVLASNVIIGAALDNRYLKWLEITRSNITSTRPLNGVLYVRYIDALIVHDIYNTSASYTGSGAGIASTWAANYQVIASNCIVYNIEGARDTSGFSLSRNDDQVLNNTVYNIKRTNASASYDCYGIRRALNTPTIKNCISVGTNAEFGSFGDFTGGFTQEYNLSSDSTASGTGSITNAVTADQFVSIVSGSEDLHLKAGSDAINAGVYLTTPDAIQYDIDGDLRGNFGLFSIGADEFVLVIDNTPDIKSSIIKLKSSSEPSYKSGFARSASESVNPQLWKGLRGAWIPEMGSVGLSRIPNAVDGTYGTLDGFSSDFLTTRGQRGLALEYSGVGDERLYTNTRVPSSGGFSIAVLYRPNFRNETAYVAGDRGSGSNYSFMLNYSGTAYWRFNGASFQQTINNSFVSAEWHLFCFRWDGAKAQGLLLYEDGTIEKTATTSVGGYTPSYDLIIGNIDAAYSNLYEVDGLIGSSYTWDRWVEDDVFIKLFSDPVAPFRKRRSVPYRKAIIDPAETLTKLGLTATPFKTFTVTDKGIVVQDANGKQFLMFVF